MSTKLRSMIMASLENADVEIMNPVTDQQETNIDEVLLQVAEEQAEATVDAEEADKVVEVFAETEQQVEELEGNLEEQISTESLTPAVIRTHNLAMANALRPLRDYYDVNRVTVSHEAFGGAQDISVLSMEALEGVKKTLKDIAAAIINAIKSAYAAAKNFFAAMGKSGAALKKAAANVVAQGEAVKGKVATGEINGAAAAKYLATGSKLSGNDVVSAIGTVDKVLLQIGANTAKSSNLLIDAAAEVADGKYDKGAFAVKLADAAFQGLPGVLPGNYRINKVVGSAPSISFSREAGHEGDFDIVPLSPEEIIKVGQAVSKLAENLIQFDKKSFKTLEANTEKFIKQLQAEAVKAEKDPEAAKNLRASMSSLSQMSHFAKSVSQQYIGYAANGAKAALGLASKSAKAYK